MRKVAENNKNMWPVYGAGSLALKWVEANDFAVLNLPMKNGGNPWRAGACCMKMQGFVPFITHEGSPDPLKYP